MLITGKIKNEIEIETPKGIRYHAEITDIRRSETAVSCAVIKDGGDDPDITTGAHIVAEVSRIDGGIQQKNRPCIGKRVRWMAACSKRAVRAFTENRNRQGDMVSDVLQNRD